MTEERAGLPAYETPEVATFSEEELAAWGARADRLGGDVFGLPPPPTTHHPRSTDAMPLGEIPVQELG